MKSAGNEGVVQSRLQMLHVHVNLGSEYKNKSREIPSTYFFRALYRPVCSIGHIVYL